MLRNVVKTSGMLWKLEECCEISQMLWNVVKTRKCCEIPSRARSEPQNWAVFASSRFHNIQRTLRKNCVQTFPKKSIRSVVRGLKLTFLEAPAKKGHQISRTAPKCCEILWNVVKSIFTTFHNIVLFFTTFPGISQHFTKNRICRILPSTAAINLHQDNVLGVILSVKLKINKFYHGK